MKTFISLLLVAITSSLMYSCDGIDDLYKHHLDGGPILYIGKVDSVSTFAGRNRLLIQWVKMQDPRASKAIISWANGTQTATVDLKHDEPHTKFVIDNLDEGTYSFKIVTYDNNNNSSVPVETIGNVYSENFEHFLKFRSHTSFSTFTKMMKFKKITADPTFVETEISYTKVGETATSMVVLGGQDTDIMLVDCDIAKPISYRGAHIPEVGCIDRFYSRTETITPVVNP